MGWIKKHKVLTVVLVLVALTIIGGAAGGGGANKVGENGQANNNAPAQTEYKVGDKVQLGEVILTINSVTPSQGAQFTKPQEGNQFLNINITLENTGKNQEFIATSGQMFILDPSNNQYQVAITDKSLENPSGGMDGNLLPSSKKTGNVGFEVPKGATGLKLKYTPSFWNDKSITVVLP